jgi:beta-lactamase regulating signal transducer with metallopeptidase domain
MTTYIIKVILCSALFFLTYKLILEKEKMPLFNRIYLLASLLLSFVIPVITFSSPKPILPIAENETLYTNALQGNGIIQILSPEQSTKYIPSILITLYLIITIVLLFRFMVNLSKILKKALENPSIPYKTSKIVLIDEDLTPHSFLNYLFIYKKEYENIENEILHHEYAHIQQKHSYDILLIELLQTFFWFNPVLLLYKKAIQLNHEYLADEAVINNFQNIRSYQHLLIDKISKSKTYNLTSQFNYSITKKRLLMMSKTKSFRNGLCRQIAILPILVVSIISFSTIKTTAQNSSGTQNSKEDTVLSTQEGVSQELIKEYEQIVNKTINEKGFPVISRFSVADQNRLETIYLSMSKDQQAKQLVIFFPAPPPLPKVVPTKTQMESWKNSKIYGLWIDGKRVSNTVLANYKNTDFSHATVSKLMKNTVNYGKHYYQVNLMTNGHYEDYYNKTIASDKKFYMGIRRKVKGNAD